MNTRSHLFLLLLLVMSGAQAQSLPDAADRWSTPALNLSLRPARTVTDAARVVPAQAATQLPYGAGFETRQLDRPSSSNAGNPGRSGGSGGGRGGAGRGR